MFLLLRPIFQLQSSVHRSLTEGEVALAQSVYGDQIDYAAVQIHKGSVYLHANKRFTAFVTYNDIYYRPEFYKEDFSQASLDEKAIFIHELQHINQYQHGVNLILDFLGLLLRHKGRYSEAYNLVEGRAFSACNIEQQAVIVDSAYFCMSRLADSGATSEEREHLLGALSHYAALLPEEFRGFKDRAEAVPNYGG